MVPREWDVHGVGSGLGVLQHVRALGASVTELEEADRVAGLGADYAAVLVRRLVLPRIKAILIR